MKIVDFEDVELHIIEDEKHEFLLSTADVAKGYGVNQNTIRDHKSNNPDEFIEGKHWLNINISVGKTDGNTRGNPNKTFWTKRGIVRLGFFIKSKQVQYLKMK